MQKCKKNREKLTFNAIFNYAYYIYIFYPDIIYERVPLVDDHLTHTSAVAMLH